MEPQAECMLVLISATPKARRNSSVSRSACGSARKLARATVDLKARGLAIAAELATSDGAPALEGAGGGVADHPAPALYRAQDRQRPRQDAQIRAAGSQGRPARDLGGAGPRDSGGCSATFAAKYRTKYAKAVTCLIKDRDVLLTFYDFPAEHWDRLRTSDPIESVFATVRHRTVRTKGALSQDAARLMVFKLVVAAAETWRRLKGENQLPKFVQGVASETWSRSSIRRRGTPPDRHVTQIPAWLPGAERSSSSMA